MGGSKMSSLMITLLPLAICFLLSLNSQVSGKPSPKHFLIETKEKARKNNDYIGSLHNKGKVNEIIDRSKNVDYTGNVNNVGGKIGGIGDGSVNSGDYMDITTLNNARGGSVVENNNHYHGYYGKK